MKKILIVDDATTVRMYHRQLMESLGYEVEEAENGIEALERASDQTFDLFLIDINMPKMDGYTLVKEIRHSTTFQSTPIIMISTEEADHDSERAYAAGANFYLVKPVRLDTLHAYADCLTGGAQ
ncbi:response regulator [Rhodanobacter aciditrophus]|uniref:Response regulator n=1 Tax=Rhodanobacter aciditrophus TaxID=1623218 RepID=A0ABW4B423_9GAMM